MTEKQIISMFGNIKKKCQELQNPLNEDGGCCYCPLLVYENEKQENTICGIEKMNNLLNKVPYEWDIDEIDKALKGE